MKYDQVNSLNKKKSYGNEKVYVLLVELFQQK